MAAEETRRAAVSPARIQSFPNLLRDWSLRARQFGGKGFGVQPADFHRFRDLALDEDGGRRPLIGFSIHESFHGGERQGGGGVDEAHAAAVSTAAVEARARPGGGFGGVALATGAPETH
jgi:hypothetical protein